MSLFSIECTVLFHGVISKDWLCHGLRDRHCKPWEDPSFYYVLEHLKCRSRFAIELPFAPNLGVNSAEKFFITLIGDISPFHTYSACKMMAESNAMILVMNS